MKHNRIKVRQGDTIFAEGEEGDAMYVILEGHVRIIRGDAETPVVLATLHKGTFFGEMAILHRTTRTASAVAAADSELMVVKAPDLELMLKQRPDLGAKMIYTLTRRLRDTTNKVMDEKEKTALLFSEFADLQPEASPNAPSKPTGMFKGALQRVWSEVRGS